MQVNIQITPKVSESLRERLRTQLFLSMGCPDMAESRTRLHMHLEILTGFRTGLIDIEQVEADIAAHMRTFFGVDQG